MTEGKIRWDSVLMIHTRPSAYFPFEKLQDLNYLIGDLHAR